MTLVCPKCGGSFESPWLSEVACPLPGCGHSWRPGSAFDPTIVTTDDRRAVPSLLVTFAGGKEQELPLASAFSIGRSPENDLPVNDLKLSRRHLRIEKRGEAYFAKDLGSSSGTLLNGQRLVESRLTPGDTLLLGDTRIQYQIRFVDTADTKRKIRVAGGVGKVALHRPEIILGRGAECDVVLSSPAVSRRHARLTKEGERHVLEDLGSANGTFIGGASVRRRTLEKGDRIRIGPYLLTFDGAAIAQEDQQGRITIEALEIGKRIGAVRILKDISVVIRPNEFVGLLGPSGAGKSTFMDTLNGFRPATSGRVFINGEDLYRNFDSFKSNIGYVPQDDIIHRELTVRQALYYTARLRLPQDTSEVEIERLVDEVITTLELTERKDTLIASLSGGQRKRVSIGVELLTKPSLLFLDEPTSGLDPGTEGKMMTLFRKLADEGRTLVLTTHVMENVEQLDLIVVLVKGVLAYYGPPKEALAYFDIPKITKIYDRLEERTPEEWEKRYRESPFHRTYVAERREHAPSATRETSPLPAKPRVDPVSQFLVLTRRYAATILGDPRNLLYLVLPGPVIGFLMTLPYDAKNPFHHKQLLVFMAITAVFCGCFNSFREIVKEKAIYKRERMVNVQLLPYALSKITLLSAIFVVECFLLLLVVVIFEEIKGSFFVHYLTLLFTAIAAAGLGLIISSVVNSSEKAIGILIVVLIPQIIFSGGIVGLSGFSEVLGYLMVSYWSYDGLAEIADKARAVVIGDWVMIGIYTALYLGATIGALRMQDIR